MTPSNTNPLSDRSSANYNAEGKLLFKELFPSDIRVVEAVVERVLHVLNGYGCIEGQCTAAELSLREALANAILHGNGSDPKKRVEVGCFGHSDGSITLVVRDEGPGFNPGNLKDPTHPENIYRDGGRGIYLIRHFMDEVQFGRNGSEIHMRKRKECCE